jgi:hypothetical protein
MSGGGGYTVQTASAEKWLDQTDINYMNGMLKDLCSSYKTIRDFKGEKKGGNFNAIPHRVGSGIFARFGGSDWPDWYATVALLSPSSEGVGKRRLILRNQGDYGTVNEAIFTPTHYGDSKKPNKPDFVRLTGLTLGCNVGFSYKQNPPVVALPAPAQIPIAVAPTSIRAMPSINMQANGPVVVPFVTDQEFPGTADLINSVLANSGAFD